MQLAIVIPAFKVRFLSRTLDSLVAQTNRSFRVYIGNDNSPECINDIVDAYRASLPITYQKFENNLGGEDLAGHWNRCIDLVDNETWVWLLPDDDIASPDCVEVVLNRVKAEGSQDRLYRFQSEHIDEEGNLLRTLPACPPLESSSEFITRKLRFERSSSVAEYVFNKKAFHAMGKFMSFPLAWGTDDMAWIKLGQAAGITTLPAGRISLRQSRFNISGTKEKWVNQKFEAKYLFFQTLLQDSSFRASLRGEIALASFRK